MDEGRIVRDGPAAEVLAWSALPGLGVEPPARVRLERAMAGAAR
jgi:hypothetical protein